MKKIITTLALSFALATAFAQKSFKPIHFTSYRQTQKSLNFDGDKDGPEQRVAGAIDINAKDSLLTVSFDAQPSVKYKITKVDDEYNDGQYDKVIFIFCSDEAGKAYTFKIDRTKTSSYAYMKIYLSPSSTMIYFTFYCDYLKKLY
jgi:hypothetical protein